MTVSSKNKANGYQVDVNRFLALCSRNYFKILRWLPSSCKQGVQWQVKGDFGCLRVKLLEKTQYTQLIEIDRAITTTQYYDAPNVLVRVYHDARLAEVLTSRQIYRLKPSYDYPNEQMYHRDEKYQVNAFLEELLNIDKDIRVICQAES